MVGSSSSVRHVKCCNKSRHKISPRMKNARAAGAHVSFGSSCLECSTAARDGIKASASQARHKRCAWAQKSDFGFFELQEFFEFVIIDVTLEEKRKSSSVLGQSCPHPESS